MTGANENLNEPNAARITEFRRLRGRVKESVTKFINDATARSITSDVIEIRYKNMLITAEKFQQFQKKLLELEDPTVIDEDELFTEKLCQAEKVYREITDQGRHDITFMEPSTSSVKKGSYRPISEKELPTFNGDVQLYNTFIKQFRTVVDCREDMTKGQKMALLVGCLTGAAANFISMYEVDDENYDTVLTDIDERYSNPHLTVQIAIQKLLNGSSAANDNPDSIHDVVDETDSILRQLKALGITTESWCPILINITINKMPVSVQRQWEMTVKKEKLPSYADLKNFLHQCSSSAKAVEHMRGIQQPKSRQDTFKTTNRQQPNTSRNQMQCVFCHKQQHSIWRCNEFNNLSIRERKSWTFNKKLCTQCLKPGHAARECSYRPCTICQGAHSKLLHDHNQRSTTSTRHTNGLTATINQNEPIDSQNPNSTTFVSHLEPALLATAQISISARCGGPEVKARSLLDTGSQANYMTSRLAQLLGASITETNIAVTGIHGGQSIVTKRTTARIGLSNPVDFLVVENITPNIPAEDVKIRGKIPPNIELADPDWHKSGPIDILLGVEESYSASRPGVMPMSESGLKLYKTIYGWVVVGNTTNFPSTSSSCNINNIEDELKTTLENFWKIEEVPQINLNADEIKSDELEEIEKHYNDTTKRDSTGRFVVRLPRKVSKVAFGDSIGMAVKRQQNLEKRFAKEPNLKKQYVSFMREYEDLGHMIQCAPPSRQLQEYAYLPHHAVLKCESRTTKCRVVFDGSAKTTSGVSLNDTLQIGASCQPDILDQLLRFRIPTWVATADIQKMYRQILISNQDQDLQRIVWRENSQDALKHYRLRTVTYGTASAPFLAIRTLMELARQSQLEYPEAAEIIKNNFYVDDLIMGSESKEELQQRKKEITQILASAGMQLHKWRSNTEKIGRPASEAQSFSPQSTLGIQWESKKDTITYMIKPSNKSISPMSKRQFLSQISKIYDPIGLLAPITIRSKLMMQKIWQQQAGWEESIPMELQESWCKLHQEMQLCGRLQIPRQVILPDARRLELHGFCDASERAYGAVIYAVSASGNRTQSSIIIAKSKVAPLKTLTIPRLELCGAVLLHQLMKYVKAKLKWPIEPSKFICWCDSTVTLQWIKGLPEKWKPFVAHRVKKIQDTQEFTWRYIPTADNPADLISRGVTPNLLQSSASWWNGPSWLSSPEQWPSNIISTTQEIPEKRKEIITTTSIMKEPCILFNRFSSWKKLLSVTAYVLRFISKTKKEIRRNGPLKKDELDAARRHIIILVQMEAYPEELKKLKGNSPVPNKSQILNLNPILRDGVICVGGRLVNAQINDDQKHPIILPSGHSITHLIISHYHEKTLHSGAQTTLYSIRQSFWPVHGFATVKKIIRNCKICFKTKPKTFAPIMGNLPVDRITPSRPFESIAVDYAGPILIRASLTRRPALVKTYIALFVCLSTKAVHIELALDLSTKEFLQVFRRFAARRGRPSRIVSDNGRNFVGAAKELKELLHHVNGTGLLNDLECNWEFHPPRAPHFSGLVEAGVKSVKNLLRKLCASNRSQLSYGELYTALTQIEACLNSRPLYPMSSDPNDLIPLTPGHFLIGTTPIAVPSRERRIGSHGTNQLTAWERMRNSFWTIWSKQYLSHLQRRTKWTKDGRTSAQPGMLVLIQDDLAPPTQWLMGRITYLHQGRDGVARVATVKTQRGETRRALRTLCPLPQGTQPASPASGSGSNSTQGTSHGLTEVDGSVRLQDATLSNTVSPTVVEVDYQPNI